MKRITYVFCHGLNGWGEYDALNSRIPYWGGRTGDVVAELRSQGVDAFAASVSPQGSAWDRACELYAQLAGTRTDYGRAHSTACRHERFGRDFTGRALIPSWDDSTRLALIGHSFGGATVRLLCELLAHGSAKERDETPAEELSPLFAGGMGERVFALVTLAAPTNGTVSYDMALDSNFDAKQVRIPFRFELLDRLMKSQTRIRMDGRDERDWANFDMLIDNAQALNARISTLPHVYYLCVACDATVREPDGICVPDRSLMDPLFVKTGTLMGRYSGKTKAGIVVDDSWRPNDGLVNTVSARAPFGAPKRLLDRGDVEKGVWNVMPDIRADHGFFQGGFLLRQDPHPFFRDLVGLISGLEP